MDRRNNPYAPGAGLQPPELAGRDRLLSDASIDMDRVLAGRPAKGLILLGLRGVGKTVLLNRLRSAADRKGFRTARIEAPEGASLPQVAALAGKAKFYAERLFDYPQVGALETGDARAALLKPAQAEGVAFDDEATEHVLQAAENYPYFIQEWGF